MAVFIALLRAVNVGGTGRLPMTDLKRLCERAGFRAVGAFLASGNVVFEGDGPEAAVKTALEAELRDYAGKPVGVVVRSAAEMAEVLAANPFPDREPNRTVAIFLDGAPRADALETVAGRQGEEVRLGAREILRPLRRGNGPLEAPHPSGARRNGAQHEYDREAREPGGGARGRAARLIAVELRRRRCWARSFQADCPS